MKSVKYLAAVAAAAFGLAAAANASAANILVNSGFETGSLAPWYNGANYGGSDWTVTNSTAAGGAYSATNFGNVELVQNFAAVAASSITQVSFYIEDTATFNAYDFQYSDSTVSEFYLNPSATSFSFFDVTANLDTSKSLVGLGIYGNSGGTTYLDDVTIDNGAVSAGVPEPSTWLLMVGGLGSVGLMLRRSKKARHGLAQAALAS